MKVGQTLRELPTEICGEPVTCTQQIGRIVWIFTAHHSMELKQRTWWERLIEMLKG